MSKLSRRMVLSCTGAVLLPLSALGRTDNAPLLTEQTYARMIGHVEGPDAYTWFSGVQYLQPVDGPTIPFVGFDTIIRRAVTVADDGSVSQIFSEANVFTDIATWRVIDELYNPLLDETVYPLHYREGPNAFGVDLDALGYAPDGLFEPDQRRLLTFDVGADQVTLVRRSISYRPHPMDTSVWKREAPETFKAITHHTYRVDREAFDASATGRVPAHYNMTVVSTWMPWMLLANVPGQLLWIGSGRKVTDQSHVPRRYAGPYRKSDPRDF